MKKVRFRYKVRDSHGKPKVGRAVSESTIQVRRALIAKGYTVDSITQEKSPLSALNFLNKISAKDRSLMYRELATMLKAGVGITQAIEIAAETPNKKLRKVLKDVSASLENGFPFSMAMASHPIVFPPVEVGVVRAGEATGNLSKVLDELSRNTARSADFVSKVRGAMIYPAFIVVVMVIIGIVILTKVIPPIRSIFETTNTELPLSTKFLLAFTDFITHGWYWVILIVIALAVAGRLFANTKKGKASYSYIALNFPIFGPLNQQTYLATLNRTLSLLVGAGVPIIEAVQIITDSTTNIIFHDSLRVLIRSLEQGSAISSALESNRYFPRLMTQLLFVGQQSGDLGGTATTLANYYESEVDSKLRTFSALIEPFIIVILGLAVGFVVISVLQPIYSLTGSF